MRRWPPPQLPRATSERPGGTSLVVTDGTADLAPGVDGIELTTESVIEDLPTSLADLDSTVQVTTERTIVTPDIPDEAIAPWWTRPAGWPVEPPRSEPGTSPSNWRLLDSPRGAVDMSVASPA